MTAFGINMPANITVLLPSQASQANNMVFLITAAMKLEQTSR